MSSPRLMRSASSALRATVTVTPTSTSGCTAMAILCLPMLLIGASSMTWLRAMVTPSLSNEAMMSRTVTDPNNWPVSEAWRNTITLRPSIFSATLVASPLACRLRVSSSAFMPSNLVRLSAVARSALPRFNRKLRANPSLTRTTSPIWPSLATRSSKMTSMLVLLRCFAMFCDVLRCFAMFCDVLADDLDESETVNSGNGKGRRLAPLVAPANVEQGIGKPERHQRQDRPAEHHDDGVGGAEPERAALHRRRQHMQHREADQGIRHHQGRGGDLREHRKQAAGEAERDRDEQGRQRHRRQRRAAQIRPGAAQLPRCRGDLRR